MHESTALDLQLGGQSVHFSDLAYTHGLFIIYEVFNGPGSNSIYTELTTPPHSPDMAAANINSVILFRLKINMKGN
jgi:hypothetical protein